MASLCALHPQSARDCRHKSEKECADDGGKIEFERTKMQCSSIVAINRMRPSLLLNN